MKSAVVENHKNVIKDIKEPELSNRKGAIVQVYGCGLCGSDIVKLRTGKAKDGTVLGHEIVGKIVEINSDTDFKVNDDIVSSHHIPCFNCEYCKNEHYSMCEHFKTTNIFPGGFSEYIFLSEEHLKNVAYKIPENMTYEEISFYEPLGCIVRAVKRADLNKNSTVLVIGLGSIGYLSGQAFNAIYGCKTFGCDLIEERINLACNAGIDAFNSSDFEKSEQFIKEKTNNMGVDAVFMTSGSDKAIELALKTVRNGGKIIVFASTPNNKGYGNNEIYYRELTVFGSYSPAPVDLKTSFELLQTGKIKVKDISTVYSLDDVQQAFDDTVSNKIFKAYIKIKE
ncbi:alcohol dehydrogenase catalytic domain-containing protein [bacterium]|nr:alcohol dehydrogenase catalytic domain-containing protein [bacterium]